MKLKRNKIKSIVDVIAMLKFNKKEFETVLKTLEKVSRNQQEIAEIEHTQAMIETMEKAIELCEKDNVKKPYMRTCSCPVCKERVPSVSQVPEFFYCQNCGQKLTWKQIR